MSKYKDFIAERAEMALMNFTPMPETETEDAEINTIIMLEKAFGNGIKSEIIYRKLEDEDSVICSVLTDKSEFYWRDKKGGSIKIHALESILDGDSYWTIIEAIPVSGIECIAQKHTAKELQKINKYSKKLAPLNRKKILQKMSDYENAGGKLSFPDHVVQGECDAFSASCCKLELLKSAMPPEVLAEVDTLFSVYDVSSSSEQKNILKILKALTDFDWLSCFEKPNIEAVRTILDESHACLSDTKDALIEELICVSTDAEHMPQPIVLIGKNGNGKKSLINAFAKGIGKEGRMFSATSLEDSIELRGSSRNYDNAQPSRLFQLISEVGPRGVLVIDQPEKAKSKGCVAALQSLVSEKILRDVFIGAPIPLAVWFFVLIDDVDNVPAWCSSYKRIVIQDYTTDELEEIVNKKLIPRYSKRFGFEGVSLNKQSVKALIELSLNRSVKKVEENLKKVICKLVLEGFDAGMLKPNHIFNMFYPNEKKKCLMSNFAKDTIMLEEKYIFCRYKKGYYTKAIEERCEKLFMDLFSGNAEDAAYAKKVLQILVNTLRDKKMTLLSIETMRRRLDTTHYGMDKVKEAALLALKKAQMANDVSLKPILFVGPPGTGKTSLAQSIAVAFQIPFAKLPLNAITDSGELIGYSRAHKDAKPGMLMAALSKESVCTYRALLLLDEVDKLSLSLQNVLLNILDGSGPMYEAYCECNLDLSQVFFIGTANSLHTISEPLLDRFKVIQLAPYTDYEKMQIAKDYIVPKLKKELNIKKMAFTDEAIEELVKHCGLEGVRDLEPAAEEVILKNTGKSLISWEDVSAALGSTNSKRKYGF